MFINNISNSASSVQFQADISRLGPSQVFSTNELRVIEKLMEDADKNTLILWDVDQTLLTPNDPILKPKWEKLLDQFLGGKKFIIDGSGKMRYIFREILMSAPHSLVDQGSVSLVQALQKREIPVIAFSAAPGGKIGKVDSFIEWRINELQQFGFDFSPAFPGIQTLELPKDPDIEFPPMYKSGVLITSLHDKGPVLISFLKELHWTPKKVIFIDDQMSNIRSVVKSLEDRMQTIGIHYTAASHIPCQLDERAAKYQVEHFLKTDEWISQSKANTQISPVVEIDPHPTPVKSILFDFGGVLVHPDEELLISYLADFFEVPQNQIRELQVKELQWIRVNDTEFSFWQKYAKEIGKDLPLDWREQYQAVKMASVKELPLIGELLQDIQKEGYTIEMLSNFEPWMEPLLDRFGYRKSFSHLYLSYQTKQEKPSADAYQTVLTDLGLQGKETVFVDDQLKNVQAAQDLGIDAILFVSAEQLREELVKRNILKKKTEVLI